MSTDDGRWAVTHCVHVWPLADQVEHELSPECPCGPVETLDERPDGHRAFLFTHSSLDGRELAEPDHAANLKG